MAWFWCNSSFFSQHETVTSELFGRVYAARRCDLPHFCTLAACLGFRKNEVLAVKKVKSSLSSSRLQYPLLMLLLLVMDGVTTVLTVMEKSCDGHGVVSGRGAQLEEVPQVVSFGSFNKKGRTWSFTHPGASELLCCLLKVLNPTGEPG